MLHIGADRVVRKKDLLMVIDLQRSLGADTQAFLDSVCQQGRLDRCPQPKSVVVTTIDGRAYAFESPVSAQTLLKRSASAVALSDQER